MGASWQPGAWGCGAMVALAAAALASQSEGGARRLQEAFGAARPVPQAIAAITTTADTTAEPQGDTQRVFCQRHDGATMGSRG